MAYDSDEENRQEFHAPRTVRDALRKYAEWRHFEPPNAWASESSTYRSVRGGNSTATSGDGGMASMADRMGRAVARYSWVLEVRSTLVLLPPDLLEVIRAMYEVPPREYVKTDRAVADALHSPRSAVIKKLERAYGWLSREMGLPV